MPLTRLNDPNCRRCFSGNTIPLLCLASSAALLIVGCVPANDVSQSEVPPIPVAEPAAVESVSTSAGETAEDGSTHRHYTGIGFNIPASWQELPDQQFVDSKFIIPTESGDMEMTLTSMGGGIEANLNRWVGQVGREPGDEPSWSTVDVAGVESKMVDVRGSFNTKVGDNPGTKQDWRLIGIAVPLPRNFFIKLAGPREAVAGFQDELDAFLKTAHADH